MGPALGGFPSGRCALDYSVMGWSTAGISLAKRWTQAHWAVTWSKEGVPREPVRVKPPDFPTVGWVPQRTHAGGAAGRGSGADGGAVMLLGNAVNQGP